MINYKFLNYITIFYVTFQLISDVTASKIILLFGQPVSITVLYFPITYIIADILTEVYGLKTANKILRQVLISSIIAGLVYQLAVFLPSVQGTSVDSAFGIVLGSVPRLLIGGWMAVYMGGFCNNYLLHQIKKITGQKHLWIRTITSTFAGELVNTVVFFVVALSGIIPNNVLLQSIIWSWIFKVVVEIVMTPLTYKIVSYLKKSEQAIDSQTLIKY
jgi:queuosine precursor transporter